MSLKKEENVIVWSIDNPAELSYDSQIKSFKKIKAIKKEEKFYLVLNISPSIKSIPDTLQKFFMNVLKLLKNKYGMKHAYLYADFPRFSCQLEKIDADLENFILSIKKIELAS